MGWLCELVMAFKSYFQVSDLSAVQFLVFGTGFMCVMVERWITDEHLPSWREEIKANIK